MSALPTPIFQPCAPACAHIAPSISACRRKRCQLEVFHVPQTKWIKMVLQSYATAYSSVLHQHTKFSGHKSRFHGATHQRRRLRRWTLSESPCGGSWQARGRGLFIQEFQTRLFIKAYIRGVTFLGSLVYLQKASIQRIFLCCSYFEVLSLELGLSRALIEHLKLYQIFWNKNLPFDST